MIIKNNHQSYHYHILTSLKDIPSFFRNSTIYFKMPNKTQHCALIKHSFRSINYAAVPSVTINNSSFCSNLHFFSMHLIAVSYVSVDFFMLNYNQALHKKWSFPLRISLANVSMAYSIYGHISYILETSSKTPNDFYLIGRKPIEILQLE